MRPILLLLGLLASTPVAAADIVLALHQSHVLDVPQGVVEISIEDPRVLAAAAIPDGRFHLQAVGAGSTDVIATLPDGTDRVFEVQVGRRAVKGKADHALQRGRAVLLEFPNDVRYVGTGNPQVVFARAFEGEARFQLVGTGEGSADVLVVAKDGSEQRLIVNVSQKNEVPEREAVALARGDVHNLVLEQRPTSVAVANGTVASVVVKRDDAGAYAVEVTAKESGVTDLLVSLGSDRPVAFWAISVR